MRIFVRPPSRPSASARELARLLGVRLLRRENSRYRYRRGDLIINWGNPDPSIGIAYLNDPIAVQTAIDKVATWDCLEAAGVPTVEWTDDPQTARHWLEPEGPRVMTRSTLRGTQGRGIEVFSYEGTEWTRDYNAFIHREQTPVYVKVFGRNPQRVTEYRVHVVGGEVIDFAQKKRSRSYEGTINPYVRSHENGWIFAREGVALPELVAEASRAGVRSAALDFGAVDVGWDGDRDRVCVYEINSAPGFDGSTARGYASAILHFINGQLAGRESSTVRVS